MVTSRRRFLLGFGAMVAAAACGPPGQIRPDWVFQAASSQNEPLPTPTRGASLPIERALDAGPDRLPPAVTSPSVSELTGEEAARSVIRVLPPQAPVLRRRLPPQRIVIPAIRVDAKVVHLGTRLDTSGAVTWETAAFAVGHHQGTAYPGENGNMVLSGHVSSRAEGDVFRRLPQIEIGDGVVVVTDEQPFLYAVRRTEVVQPDEVELMGPTAEPTCTIITCVPDGIYTHRLVVRAVLI